VRKLRACSGNAHEAKNSRGKRQRTEIVASRVQFLDTPPAGEKAEVGVVEEPAAPVHEVSF
jgi:hypothetical protein